MLRFTYQPPAPLETLADTFAELLDECMQLHPTWRLHSLKAQLFAVTDVHTVEQ